MSFHNSTTTYEWHDESVSASEGVFGTESTFRVTRRVRRIDGAQINVASEISVIISENVVPVPFQFLGAGPPSSLSNRLFDLVRCREWTYTVDPQRRTLTFSILYSTPYYVEDTTSNSFVLPSTVTYQTVTRMAKIYRRGWAVDPPPASDTSADIGGTAVDGAGQTTTVQVSQMRMRINTTQDASFTINKISTIVLALSSLPNARNSLAFGPFAAGYLVCEGFNITPTQTPFYEITIDILWDAWAHHEQVAETGADGRPNLTAGNLSAVYWKRLPRASEDFNEIFGTPVDVNWRNRTLEGWFA